MLNEDNIFKLQENEKVVQFYFLIQNIHEMFNFSLAFDINIQHFETIVPITLNIIEYIINKYNYNQGINGIIHLYQISKIKEELKRKTSNKFCVLCLFTLLWKIENSITIPSLFISFMFQVIQLYLKDIIEYQNNQKDIIYFINFVSSYLFSKNIFNNNNYSIIFKHNLDLMKSFYLQFKDQKPIRFFVDILSKYFLSFKNDMQYLLSRYDFIRNIYLHKLFEFTCEENILNTSKLNIFLNEFFKWNQSKELFIVDPLNKFIDYFADIKHKNEHQLEKEMLYLKNNLELIHLMNTQINNLNCFLLNEIFYIKENVSPLITSKFHQKIEYPFYIVFSIKMIYNDSISINDEQQPSFYLKLYNNKYPENYIKIVFHKRKIPKEIDITIEVENQKRTFYSEVVSNQNNLILIKINQENTTLTFNVSSTQCQREKISLNDETFSVKPIKLKKIDIGIYNNEKKILICELGKLLILNKYNSTSKLFNSIKDFYLKATLNFGTNNNTLIQKQKEKNLFEQMYLISPLPIIYNIRDNDGNYFFSSPNINNLIATDDLDKSVYVYKINTNISKNFHCVINKTIFEFLLEMEGLSYLTIHCEYYYQVLIQHKENISLMTNIFHLIHSNILLIMEELQSLLVYIYDNYQSQIKCFIQDITKLLNQILKTIYEIAKFNEYSNTKGIPFNIFVQIINVLNIIQKIYMENKGYFKQILFNIERFLFNPLLYSSFITTDKIQFQFLQLSEIQNKNLLQLSPSIQLSMLLTLKSILPNNNQNILKIYSRHIVKVILSEKTYNSNHIVTIIQYFHNDNNKSIIKLFYYILKELYIKDDYFVSISNDQTILKLFINEFQERFQNDQVISHYSRHLYQLMLVIIIEMYEVTLLKEKSDGNQYEQLNNKFEIFLLNIYRPCLYTLNALLSCLCDIDRIKFSLDKLAEGQKIKLQYQYDKIKDTKLKHVYLEVKSILMKNILISISSSLYKNDAIYSPKYIYNYIIIFLQHIDNDNQNLNVNLNYETNLNYLLYNNQFFFNELFLFAFKNISNYNLVLKNIDLLYSIILHDKITDCFIYDFLTYFNDEHQAENRQEIILTILQNILNNFENKQLNSCSLNHFGKFLSIFNYLNIYISNSNHDYLKQFSFISMLFKINRIIKTNNLFSNPNLFVIPKFNKGKIIIELYIEMIMFVIMFYKEDYFLSTIIPLFKNDNNMLVQFEELETNDELKKQSLNEYNFPTINILNCSITQYVLIKYIMFYIILEDKRYLIEDQLEIIIINYIKLLKKVFKSNNTIKYISDDCSLYNSISDLNVDTTEEEIKSNLINKIKSQIDNNENHLNIFLFSISDINKSKFEEIFEITNKGDLLKKIIKNKQEDNFQLPNKKEFHYIHNLNDYDDIIIKFKNEILLGKYGFVFKKYYFYNENFINVKKNYLLQFQDDNVIDKQNTFPSKIKNYSHKYNPPLFLKQDFSFFDNKLLSVSHSYLTKIPNSIRKIKIINTYKEYIYQNIKDSKTFYCEVITNSKTILGEIKINKYHLIFKQIHNFKDTIVNTQEYNINNICLLYNRNSLSSDDVVHNVKYILIYFSQIKEMIIRRYMLIEQSIEIFLLNGKSYLINFLHSSFFKCFLYLIALYVKDAHFFSGSRLCKEKVKFYSKKWINGDLSTFNYILNLNYFASRSFNDMNQYPVFPWCSTLNDNNIIDRNFTYPIACQDKQKQDRALEKYDELEDEPNEFQSHFGTHYSTANYVYYYLVRTTPHLYNLISQNNSLENPNRLFYSFIEPQRAIKQGNDNREAIPELYSSIDFFLNLNYAYLGRKINKFLIDDFNSRNKKNGTVSDVVKTIIWHRNLLDSFQVKINIHKWFDWVFGNDQLKKDLHKRRERCNVFNKSSYQQLTNLEKIYAGYLKENLEMSTIQLNMTNYFNIISNFGVVPMQLFFKKHPNISLLQSNKTQNKKMNSLIKDVFYIKLHKHENNGNLSKFLIYFYHPKENYFSNYIKIYAFKSNDSKIKKIFTLFFRNALPINQINKKYVFENIDGNTLIFAHILDCSNSVSINIHSINKKQNNHQQFSFQNKLTSLSLSYFDKDKNALLFLGFQNGKILSFIIDIMLCKISPRNSILAHLYSVDFLTINKHHSLLISASNKEKDIYVRKVYDFELITVISMKRTYLINNILCSKFGTYYIVSQENKSQTNKIFGYTLNGVLFSECDYEGKINLIELSENGKLIVFGMDCIKMYHGGDLKEEIWNEKVDLSNMNVIFDEDNGYKRNFQIYAITNKGKFMNLNISNNFAENFEKNQHYLKTMD